MDKSHFPISFPAALSTCSIMGLGHVSTLENTDFQLTSSCRHTVLKSCDDKGKDFSVEVQMVKTGGFSAVEHVYLLYAGHVSIFIVYFL